MSLRLKQGMREILRDMTHTQSVKEEALLRSVADMLREDRGSTGKSPSIQVTQNIYAKETSYVAQQREAARNFRQIARALA
jgi:hypothetical protein